MISANTVTQRGSHEYGPVRSQGKPLGKSLVQGAQCVGAMQHRFGITGGAGSKSDVVNCLLAR